MWPIGGIFFLLLEANRESLQPTKKLAKYPGDLFIGLQLMHCTNLDLKGGGNNIIAKPLFSFLIFLYCCTPDTALFSKSFERKKLFANAKYVIAHIAINNSDPCLFSEF